MKKTYTSNLAELMEENGTDVKMLKNAIGLHTTSVIYDWINGKKGLRLDTAIKIADYFCCSLDYLSGNEKNYDETKTYKTCPPFATALRKILCEKNISQNKLLRELPLSGKVLNNWLSANGTPQMSNVIRLAKYFGVSIDYLVGRE